MSTRHIYFRDIDVVPDRSKFIDAAMHKEVAAAIAENREVYFLPNDVYEATEYTGGVNKYVVYLFGVLPDGNRAMVTLDGVDVYFDVLVEDGEDASQLLNVLTLEFKKMQLIIVRSEFVRGYKQAEFTEEPSTWIRFYFYNLRDRHSALSHVRSQKSPTYVGECDGFKEMRKTASDDDGGFVHNFYYPKIAREQSFVTCGWNKLPERTYSVTHKDFTSHKSPNCKYCFRINVRDYTAANVGDKFWANRDKTMIAAWDIETYTHESATGDVPAPSDTNWNIFMMCITFHWQYTSDALLKVCIVDRPTGYPGVDARNDDVFYDSEVIAKAAETLAKNFKAINPNVVVDDAMKQKFIADAKEKQSQYNYIIECGTEQNILLAFTEILKRMSPEILVAFNGGGFDWPMVREKMMRERMLQHFKKCVSALPLNIWLKDGAEQGDTEANIYKYSWTTERVKISAEEMANMLRLNVPGVLDTDCMIVFKQMYPKTEVRNKFSLNFFLTINKLPSKEDLPYKTMFGYYKSALDLDAQRAAIELEVENAMLEKLVALGKKDSEILQIIKSKKGEIVDRKMSSALDEVRGRMAIVAKYCDTDSFRCQQLYTARSIVSERREIGSGAFVPLFAGFYRAGGMKVRHIVGNACFNYDKISGYKIMFSNARPSNLKVKYPGAWVFPPTKGLNVKRPVVGLDFASLYPSLMMAYNLSPEKSIEDGPGAAEKVASLKTRGYILHRIDFNAEVTDEKAPNCGAQLPVGGWTIRHSNVRKRGDKVNHVIDGVPHPRQSQDPLPGEMMGIFPATELQLFNDRKTFKNKFTALEKLLERMKVIRATNDASGKYMYDYSDITDGDLLNTGFTRTQLMDPTLRETIAEDIAFECIKTDSKQKAKKVFMNTFYGEQGNSLSSIYKLLVAGAITESGQQNIKMVSELCTSNGYYVWYGDTDSCYISSPDAIFTQIDARYNEAVSVINNPSGVVYSDISQEIIDRVAAACMRVHLEYKEKYKLIEHRLKEKSLKPAQIDALNAEEFREYMKKLASVSHEIDELSTESFREYSAELLRISNEISADVDEHQRACIRKLMFYRIREEYWTIMVQITRRDLNRLRLFVNNHLKSKNGTGYLNMAYEEVLFPVVFTGKKKYTGFAHLEEENFHPSAKDIFIRGIDIVKQGQSNLAREIGMEIIQTACSVRNELDLCDIIEQKIKHIYSAKWDLRHFVLNAKYKPHKKNVAINTFADRMRREHEIAKVRGDLINASLRMPPEPGDPFQYVVVVKEQEYSIRGTKIAMGKSDRMEYTAVYNASLTSDTPLRIDLNYYMEGAIIGLLARFIAYKPEFNSSTAPVKIIKTQDEEETPDTEEDDQDDARSIKLAKVYVKRLCDGLSGIDHALANETGKRYRKISRDIEKSLTQKLVEQPAANLVISQVDLDSPNVDGPAKAIMTYAEHLAAINPVIAREMSKEFLKEARVIWKTNPALLRTYFELYKVKLVDGRIHPKSKLGLVDEQIMQRMEEVRVIMPKVIEYTRVYKDSVAELIVTARSQTSEMLPAQIEKVTTFSADATAIFVQLQKLIFDLAGLYSIRHNLVCVTNAMYAEYAKHTGGSVLPIDIPGVGQTMRDIIPQF